MKTDRVVGALLIKILVLDWLEENKGAFEDFTVAGSLIDQINRTIEELEHA